MLFFCKVLTSEGRYRWCCGCARSCQGVLRKLLQARRYPQFVVPVHLGLMDRRASRDKINMSLRLWFTLLERIVLVMQSGRTLMQALHSLTLTSLHPLQGTFVTRTVQTLRSGQFFYEIMRQLLPRRIVSERHAYLVQCAELGGYLTDGLNCLLEHIRLKLKIQKQALSCCIYPAFIVLIGTFVLFFIVSYILPQFREFFEAQAIDVPKLLSGLFFVGDFIGRTLPYGVILFIGLALCCRRSILNWIVNGLFPKLPGYRYFVEPLQLGWFAMNFSTLLKNGVYLTDSLRLSVSCLTVYSVDAEAVMQQLLMGKSLSASCPWLPKFFLDTLESAEISGQLASVVDNLSKYYFQMYENRLMQFTKWLEPICLIILAGLIILLVVILFMPMAQVFQGVYYE